jgi:hypothetical protein
MESGVGEVELIHPSVAAAAREFNALISRSLEL